MGRFVKNLDGVVHAVEDAFKLPQGWVEAAEADIPAWLKGEPHPIVEAHQDRPGTPQDEVQILRKGNVNPVTGDPDDTAPAAPAAPVAAGEPAPAPEPVAEPEVTA